MSKNIAIFTFGTRGDVQPFIALAQEMADRGHKVELLGPDIFAPLATRYKTPYVALKGNMSTILSDNRFAKFYRWGLLSNWYYVQRIQRQIGATALSQMVEAAKRADCIVFHPLMSFATDIAEALGTPTILAALQPVVPTTAFPFFVCGKRSMGARLNRLSYHFIRSSRWSISRRIDNARKKLLGASRRSRFTHPFEVNGEHVPVIHAFSRSVVPVPADWPAQVVTTGNWFVQETGEWQPEPELRDFLRKAPKPIFVGFGSNPLASVDDIIRHLCRALELTGQRAVYILEPGRTPPCLSVDDSERLMITGPVPHTKLLPFMTAAIHHGAAGTTAASLSAGLATLMCPLVIDQSWWADRVWKAGAGPQPLPLVNWHSTVVAERISDLVGNKSYASNAAAIAKTMAKENGVAQAADFIETQISG